MHGCFISTGASSKLSFKVSITGESAVYSSKNFVVTSQSIKNILVMVRYPIHSQYLLVAILICYVQPRTIRIVDSITYTE